MFARHGLHESLASNNGTRFIATEFGTTRNKIPQGNRNWMAPGERGRSVLKIIQICTCRKKNYMEGRDEFLPYGLCRGLPHVATGLRVQLYYFWKGSTHQTLWAERYKECMIEIENLFYALFSSRSYRFVYRRHWRAMRMLTRRKVRDTCTLPGSSATREEKQAHNLIRAWFHLFHLSTSRFKPGLTQSHSVAKQAR